MPNETNNGENIYKIVKDDHRFSATRFGLPDSKCQGFAMRGQCCNAKGNRRIEINHNLQKLKAKARENLESEIGKEIYSRRCVQAEPVFGNIKQNKHFKRFILKQLHKIYVELALIAIAHKFSKWTGKILLEDLDDYYSIKNSFKALLNKHFKLNFKYSLIVK